MFLCGIASSPHYLVISFCQSVSMEESQCFYMAIRQYDNASLHLYVTMSIYPQ
nr:MAG TPA: hypothetical protein [Caudoviricetes sp.]